MINWLNNPHASFVLAAYGLAAICLGGLLMASWIGARKADAAWRKTQQQKQAKDAA